MSTKSSHEKQMPIAPGFCHENLRRLVACSDELIVRSLSRLPAHDLARLARLVKKAAEE